MEKKINRPHLHPAIRKTGVLLTLLLFVTAVNAAPVVITKKGVTISVSAKKSGKYAGGFRPFQIRVKNRTKKHKTVHGEISLFSGQGNKADTFICVVYVAAPAKKTTTQIVKCKSKRRNSAWKFTLKKIWPFILK